MTDRLQLAALWDDASCAGERCPCPRCVATLDDPSAATVFAALDATRRDLAALWSPAAGAMPDDVRVAVLAAASGPRGRGPPARRRGSSTGPPAVVARTGPAGRAVAPASRWSRPWGWPSSPGPSAGLPARTHRRSPPGTPSSAPPSPAGDPSPARTARPPASPPSASHPRPRSRPATSPSTAPPASCSSCPPGRSAPTACSSSTPGVRASSPTVPSAGDPDPP